MSGKRESNYCHDYGYPYERIPYPLRRWNSHTMSWVPERIDVPTRGKHRLEIIQFQEA